MTNTNDNWPEAEVVTPTWMGLLPSILQAYSHLSNIDDPTHDELDNLRVLRGELSRMARGADMMNESSDFINEVYVIAFGCDCDDKSDEDVLRELRERTGTL